MTAPHYFWSYDGEIQNNTIGAFKFIHRGLAAIYTSTHTCSRTA